MDDGELDDFSNQELFTCEDIWDLPIDCSMDNFFDDILKDSHECTHTHTCNPPGPDLSHTHTCLHIHTKTLSAPSDEKIVASDHDTSESTEKKSMKRPLSNREAVRKYREKKKARAASLEDEVENLRALNQQLMKRLQRQSALEAEVVRLKCLLVDIRGRIDGEIGSFPYQNVASKNINPCNNLQCEGKEADFSGEGLNSCEFGNLQCFQKKNGISKDISVASRDVHAAKAS
ncbi:basic leucine zipper 19-like [Impatiens glandulifera]|uniref:basic leucine zipper 19-like n=1 Tax=Impatiens glandulifera TaxID=253017 RepID=UPI001FB17D97|nr:basic leucine zipper 19-like [Impatiens glandulifera]